jgi:lysophospholipid acyltransferase (LPLAT)-like uncharacterized protein
LETYKLKWADRLFLSLALPLFYLLCSTLRIREEGRRDLGLHSKPKDSALWAFWHEDILINAWYHRFFGIQVMISSSRDGELIAQFVNKLGYHSVRGSTTRGGREVAQAMIQALKSGFHGAITPDGPKGPRRVVQPGAAIISRLSGKPVVPIGFAAERAWRFKSWDRFMVPKPFSRIVIWYGEPIRPDKSQGGAEGVKAVQTEMDRVMAAAEGCFEQEPE